MWSAYEVVLLSAPGYWKNTAILALYQEKFCKSEWNNYKTIYRILIERVWKETIKIFVDVWMQVCWYYDLDRTCKSIVCNYGIFLNRLSLMLVMSAVKWHITKVKAEWK